MSSRFRHMPSYYYVDNADGRIDNPAVNTLRDYTITGNSSARQKNLIPYPYVLPTQTLDGITFTDNGDGSITVNGTLTGDFIIYRFIDERINFSLPVGEYFLSGCPQGGNGNWFLYLIKYNTETEKWTGDVADKGSGAKITNQNDFTSVRIWIGIKGKGTVCDNLVFKPQIETGAAATEYEPYKAVGDYDAESGKYKISVKNGAEVTNILLDAPIKPGESINKINDNLPDIKLHDGTNVLTVQTEVSPSAVNWQYYKY